MDSPDSESKKSLFRMYLCYPVSAYAFYYAAFEGPLKDLPGGLMEFASTQVHLSNLFLLDMAQVEGWSLV